MLSRTAAVRLAEAVKHVGQESRIDADTRVGNLDLHLAGTSRNFDADSSPHGCEFGSIAENVPEDLLEAVRIARDDGMRRVELHLKIQPPLGEHGAQGIDSSLDDGGNDGGQHRKPQLAGSDSRKVKQILDELGLGNHV